MTDDPNSPAAKTLTMRTVYYRNPQQGQPAAVQMYSVDAHNAVGRHPKEWSFEPWGERSVEDKPHPYAAVEIPEDWRDQTTQKRRALAMALGAKPTVKGSEAEDIIAEEMDRRAKLQEQQSEYDARQPTAVGGAVAPDVSTARAVEDDNRKRQRAEEDRRAAPTAEVKAARQKEDTEIAARRAEEDRQAATVAPPTTTDKPRRPLIA